MNGKKINRGIIMQILKDLQWSVGYQAEGADHCKNSNGLSSESKQTKKKKLYNSSVHQLSFLPTVCTVRIVFQKSSWNNQNGGVRGGRQNLSLQPGPWGIFVSLSYKLGQEGGGPSLVPWAYKVESFGWMACFQVCVSKTFSMQIIFSFIFPYFPP